MNNMGPTTKIVLPVAIFLLVVTVFHDVSGHPLNRVMSKDGYDVMEMNQKEAAGDGAAEAPPHGDDIKGKESLKFDAEMAKKIEKLPVEKLKPADHIDGVKMEQDGHINKEYHKELFLGEAHEEFKSETFDEAEDKLKEVVSKADENKDDVLDRTEMEQWILANMKKHFAEAQEENEHIFKHLDPDGDGFVTWKEYYAHFLLSRGFEPEKVVQHVKDYDDAVKMEQDDLLLADKDMLVSYKFKWTDADKEPTDNQLSKAEFMVFRHPEQSKSSLMNMVENVMQSIDSNHDGMMAMEEFAALPPGEVEGNEFEEMDRKWQEERRKEFREIIDINHDGQATTEELKRYLDPTNPVQAKIETDSLLSMIDDNKDEKLSMEEIMAHSEIFIASKLANFAANVHDEF